MTPPQPKQSVRLYEFQIGSPAAVDCSVCRRLLVADAEIKEVRHASEPCFAVTVEALGLPSRLEPTQSSCHYGWTSPSSLHHNCSSHRCGRSVDLSLLRRPISCAGCSYWVCLRCHLAPWCIGTVLESARACLRAQREQVGAERVRLAQLAAGTPAYLDPVPGGSGGWNLVPRTWLAAWPRLCSGRLEARWGVRAGCPAAIPGGSHGGGPVRLPRRRGAGRPLRAARLSLRSASCTTSEL